MAIGSRILSLFTLSTLAVFLCSLQSTPANALSIEHHLPRSLHQRGHDALAKRKRSTTTTTKKRCKPRSPSSSGAPSSSAAPSSSPTPAPTSTQSSSQSAPSSTASTSNNDSGNSNSKTPPGAGGKLALAWPNGDQNLAAWKNAKLLYTWNPACPSQAEQLGIDCCPMLWGWNMVDQFQQTVQGNPPKCAMGMNEPEIPGQSNIDVKDGINMWNQHIRPLGQKGTYLYSPAVTSDPAGKQWLQDFFNGCGGDDMCGVDVLTLHWYATSADDFKSYLQDMYTTFIQNKGNKIQGIYVSEFACQSFTDAPQCSEDQVWSFMGEVTSFMQSTEWILHFSPFGAMHQMQGVNPDNQLMGSDGSPNALAHGYGY